MGALTDWFWSSTPPGGTEVAAREMHGLVAETFTAVLRAWNNRDADAMRSHVSRSYLDTARKALDALDRDFQVNRIEDVKLRNVAVQRPADGRRYVPVDAYLAFVARIWLEDLRTGDVLSGDAEAPRAFTQRWTFVFERRHGWVTDHAESIWTASAERMSAVEWPGLPAGWYSTRGRASSWRQWDGEAWIDPAERRGNARA